MADAAVQLRQPRSSLTESIQQVGSRYLSKWWVGFICVVGAGLASCFYSISVKRVTSPLLEDPLPIFYVLLIRQWSIFFANVPVAVYKRVPIIEFGDDNKVIWGFLTLRSISATISVATGIIAIRRLSLPEFTTITATGPFITSVISWPIFKQRPKLIDFLLFLVCLAGVAFIVRPAFIFDSSNSDPPDAMGCMFAFISVLMQSVMFVTFGCLRKVPIVSVTTVYGCLTGILALMVVVAFHFRLPSCCRWTRLETIVEGLLSCARINLDMCASKSLAPAFLALLDPVSELIFQYLWQILVNGVVPHVYSVVGTCIILAALFCLLVHMAVVNRILQHSHSGFRTNEKVPLIYKILLL